MRGKSREINVFGLSMLDVMCGALGAFMLLFLSVLAQNSPLDKEERQELERLRDENQQLEEERDQAEEERDSAREERDTLESLATAISWEGEGADVDLWVRPPSGEWYGPKVEFRKGIKSAYRVTDVWEKPFYESLTVTSVSKGVWYIGFRVQSKATPAQWVSVGGFLFANLSVDYQGVWQFGRRLVFDEGRFYLLMRFTNEDGVLRYDVLTAEETKAIEDEFNALGAGPPEVLWLPGEREELQRRREEEAAKRKRELEERQKKLGKSGG